MNWLAPVTSIAGFVRSQLSDKDGMVSNTRVCILMVIVSTLSWVSCLFWKLHTPVTVTDIVTLIGAAGPFATMLCGTLAALKYGADAITRVASPGPQVQPPGAKPE